MEEIAKQQLKQVKQFNRDLNPTKEVDYGSL
jgi:hypothetical protein